METLRFSFQRLFTAVKNRPREACAPSDKPHVGDYYYFSSIAAHEFAFYIRSIFFISSTRFIFVCESHLNLGPIP